MELNLPTAFLVLGLARSILHIIGHNFDIVGFWSDKVDKESANDRDHSGGEDNYRHVVLLGPLVEVFERKVELDVITEGLNAIGERCLDTVKHFREGISAYGLEHEKPGHACWQLIYLKLALPSRTSRLPLRRNFSPNPKLSVYYQCK